MMLQVAVSVEWHERQCSDMDTRALYNYASLGSDTLVKKIYRNHIHFYAFIH